MGEHEYRPMKYKALVSKYLQDIQGIKLTEDSILHLRVERMNTGGDEILVYLFVTWFSKVGSENKDIIFRRFYDVEWHNAEIAVEVLARKYEDFEVKKFLY